MSLLLLAALALPPAAAQEPPPAPEAEAPAPAPASPVSYRIQPARSDVYVIIRNDEEAWLSRLGHDHVIYADAFTGEVTWSATDAAACKVAFTVPVDALVVDPPGLRDKAGLDDNTIDDGDKTKLKRNMWGKSQLAASDHPAVTFRSTSCSGTSGTVTVKGELTIRGATQAVSVPMKVQASPEGFSAKGTFDTTHTAFGFSPFKGSPAGPKNQDRLTFVVDVRGVPAS